MNKIKLLVQTQLAKLAKQLINKHQPVIIAITGSVGKTSTRDAIYYVLRTKYRVRKPDKNLNNEFGLPLAVMGVNSPSRNIFSWLQVFLSGYLNLWFSTQFPEVLVLEMGVDKPGDMDYLLDIATPDIAVITYIGSAHYEFFMSERAVAKEKAKIIQSLDKDGFAVLNADCKLVLEQTKLTAGTIKTYSTKDQASNVTVKTVNQNLEVPANTEFVITANLGEFSAKVNAVGQGHNSAIAAAVTVAEIMKLDKQEIISGLLDYKPVPGRLNFLKGIKKILLIDDSYNASPDSMLSALDVLAQSNRVNKIAVLGDMLELGTIAEESHLAVGKKVVSLKLAKLITVGPMAKIIANSAIQAGYSQDQVMSFDNSTQTIKYLLGNLIPESAILVKGSQGMRMEIISKELLAEPMSASQVLPRQYGSWLN